VRLPVFDPRTPGSDQVVDKQRNHAFAGGADVLHVFDVASPFCRARRKRSPIITFRQSRIWALSGRCAPLADPGHTSAFFASAGAPIYRPAAAPRAFGFPRFLPCLHRFPRNAEHGRRNSDRAVRCGPNPQSPTGGMMPPFLSPVLLTRRPQHVAAGDRAGWTTPDDLMAAR